MNRRELEREGKKWVEEGIISADQLDEILKRQESKNPGYLVLLFAVLLIGLGFLTFMMSDWARVPHISRVAVIIIVTVFLYVLGDVLNRKREDILGIGFIVIGYIVFGSGMLLIIDIYGVTLYSAWPYVIWTVVGLMLIYLYKHQLLYAVVLGVVTFGQMYMAADLSQFSWVLFGLFLLGLGYLIYQMKNKLFSYLFAISYTIQMFVLAVADFDQYYWFLALMIPLYLASDFLKDDIYKLPLKYISIASIFIYGMYQTFLLQEEWFQMELEFELSFIIVWVLLFAAGVWLKFMNNNREELTDFILFIPVMFLPLSYFFSLIMLFLFSLGWIFIGYYKTNHSFILLGTIAFLFSTFTAYIQFAWDAINRSLFFFIGGILLLCISFLIDKQLRKIRREEEKQ